MANDELQRPRGGSEQPPAGAEPAMLLASRSSYTAAAEVSHGIRYVNAPEAMDAAPVQVPRNAQEQRQAVAATLKEFAAHTAHEVSNPLNAIGINAELCLSLLKLGRVAEAIELLERLNRDCWAAGDEVRSCSRLGESLSQPVEPLSLSSLVQDVLARIAAETRRSPDLFDFQPPDDLADILAERYGASYALRYLVRRLVSDAVRRLHLQIRPLGAQHQLLTVHCEFVPAMDPGATRPPIRLGFFQRLLEARDLRLEWLKDGRTGFEISFPRAP